MLDDTYKRWYKLCKEASVEQDPKKFHALVTKIDRLLQEREDRLKQQEKDLLKQRCKLH